MKYKIIKYQNPSQPIKKVGQEFKDFAGYMSGTIGNLGLNLPFDALRDVGISVPVTSFSPTAYTKGHNTQSLGQFTKNLTGNALNAAATDVGGELAAKGLSLTPKIIPAAKDIIETWKTNHVQGHFNVDRVNLQKYKTFAGLYPNLGPLDQSKVAALKFKKAFMNPGSAKAINLQSDINDIYFDSKSKALNKAHHQLIPKVDFLGEGGFGTAFTFNDNPNIVLKVGKSYEGNETFKLANILKPFNNDPYIAVPSRIEKLAKDHYAWVMNKVPGESVHRLPWRSVPRSSIAEAAWKVRALQKEGVHFDFKGDNLLFDPQTKKLGLLDLNVMPNNQYSDFFEEVNKPNSNLATALRNKVGWAAESKEPRVVQKSLIDSEGAINPNQSNNRFNASFINGIDKFIQAIKDLKQDPGFKPSSNNFNYSSFRNGNK